MRKYGKLFNKAMAYVLSAALGITSLVIPMPTNVSAAPTSPLDLGSPSFSGSDTYELKDLNVSLGGLSVKNVAITVDSGEIVPPSNVSSYGTVTTYQDYTSTTYVFAFNSALSESQVQSLLQSVVFETDGQNPQKVTVKLNNCSIDLPAGVTDVTSLVDANGNTHYYAFIESTNISWVNAYNKAKSYTFMGMKGYLATITSKEEDLVLDRVNPDPGWAGGIRNKSLCSDSNEITLPEGPNSRIPFDGDADDANSINNEANFDNLYWACGPEAGTAFGDKGGAQGYVNWRSDEPNNDHSGHNDNTRVVDNAEGCLQIHYAEGSENGWNDLPNLTNNNNPVVGYFVEFGGYPVVGGVSTDPGLKDSMNEIVDEQMIVVDPTEIKINVSGTVSGTNSAAAQKVVFTAADGTKHEAELDASKNYSKPGVPMGSYDVTVLDAAGNNLYPTPAKADVSGTQGSNKTYNFEVSQTLVTITGKVGGNAADDVTKITYTDADGKGIDADVVDGTYTISNVPVGEYTVTVDTPGATVTPAKQEVKADKTTGYDVNANYPTVKIVGSIWSNPWEGVAQKAEKIILYKNGVELESYDFALWDKAFSFEGDYTPGEYEVVILYDTDKQFQVFSNGTENNKIIVPQNPTSTINRSFEVRLSQTITVTGDVTGTKADDVDKVVLTPVDKDGKPTGGTPIEAEVNDDGSFEIKDVPEGTYEVAVKDKDGKDVTPSTPQKFDVTTTSPELDIVAGDPVTTVSGDITGPKEKDVDKVELVGKDGTKYPADVTTDPAGEKTYEVPNVPAGEYTVNVTDKDGKPLKADPDEITVPSNPTAPVTQNIEVDAVPTNPVLVPVSGKVKGTNADKVNTVVLTPADGSEPYTTVLNKNNTYQISDVPEGTYTVTTLDGEGKEVPNQTPSITVVDGKTTGYDITVDKVTPDPEKVDVKGDVTGTKADDVDKVVLTPVDKDGKPTGETPIEAKVNDDGSFEIKDVPEGTYEVAVKDKDGKDVTPSSPSKYDVTTGGPELDIVAGDPVTTVSGDITGPKEKDVDKVELVGKDGTKYPADVTTDPTGEKTYEVPSVPAGEYTVNVTDKDGKPLKAEPEKVTVPSNPITPVSQDIKVDRVVDVTGDVTGTKADDVDKVVLTPVDGDGKPTGTPIEAEVNDDGSFEIPEVPEGTYDVSLKDDKGNPVEPVKPGTITVTPDAPDFDLTAGDPAVVVSGDITGPKEKDVDKVELVGKDGTKYPADVTTDPTTGEKTYEVPNVPAGEYTVDVTDKDGKPLKADPEKITVPENPTTPVSQDVAVDRVVDVTGDVTGTKADDVDKVVLTPVDGDGKPSGTPIEAEVKEDGSFEIPEVPEGTYDVSMKDDQGNPVEPVKPGKITVTPEATDFDLIAGDPVTTVKGDITGPKEDDVKTIDLVDDKGNTYPADITTDPTGEKTYEVPNVPAGTYEVVAKDENGDPLQADPAIITVPTNPTAPVEKDIEVNEVPVNPTVVGTITGTDADDVEKVILTPVDGGKPIEGTVDEDGTYSVPDVPEGKYDVTLEDKNGDKIEPVTPSQVEVTPDNKRFDLVAGDPVTDVAGDITGPKEADAAAIELVDKNNPTKKYPGKITEVTGDKTYVVPNVPAGTYDVEVKDAAGKPLKPTPDEIVVKDTTKPVTEDIAVDEYKVPVEGNVTGPVKEIELTDGTNTYPGTIVPGSDPEHPTYSIPDVPAGTYDVVAKDPEGNPLDVQPGKINVPEKATDPVNKDVTAVPFEVLIEGELVGTNKKVVEKIVLTSTDGKNTEYPVVPYMDETFVFEKAIPVGTYTVATYDEDGKPVKNQTPTLKIEKDKTTGYVINVNRTETNVTGEVKGTKADEVTEVVLVDKDNPQITYPAKVDNGKYEAKDVPFGEYDVIVPGTQYPVSPSPIQVVDEPDKTYDIYVDDNDPSKLGDVKDDAKKELEDKADEAKKDIDNNPDLTDKQKEDAKKDIDDAKQKADDAIDGTDNPKDAREEQFKGEDGIDDAVQKAIDGAIGDAKDNAKKEIDNLPNLTPEQKKDYKDQVDGAKTKKDVDAIVDDAIKADAKKDIDKKADEAKNAIDDLPNLTPEQKKPLKDEVDQEATKAKDSIDKAKKPEDVKKAADDGKKAIDGVVDKAKAAADPYANLTPEEKELLKTTKTVGETEKEIFKTNTDKKEVGGSTFYQLRLRAYGKNKAIKLKWIKQTGADGYIIYGAACGNKYKKIKTIKNGKTTTWTQKKRKKATYYKYMIVAYREIAGEKRVIAKSISAHSTTTGGKKGNPTKVTVNKTKVTLKKGKTYQLKAKYQSKKKVNEHIAIIRFESTNKKVATVTKKGGKIKAVGKGTCTVYVHAQNGFWKKVKVTVK